MAEAPERRSPRGDGWTQLPDPVVGVSMWRHLTGVFVTSSVDRIDGDGPTWHIAVSHTSASGNAVRAGRTAVRLARWAFEMEDAEEDNHAPARIIRSFWLPVDPARRKPCACQVEAPEEVSEAGPPGDRDTYVWRPDRRAEPASGGGRSVPPNGVK